jgi:L-malate glycosyltransferase
MMATVLHLRSSTGLYGAEQMLLGLCREQTRRGLDSTIAAFAPKGQPAPALLSAATEARLQTAALPCRGPIDPTCVQALRALISGLGIEVLHCHDYKSIVYGSIACGSASGTPPVARVATLHGWLQGDLRLQLYHWLEARTLRGFHRVCAVSDQIADRLFDQGIEADRIVRVDNGVDTDRFRAVDNPLQRGERDAIVLGVAARLSPEKNLAQLILAVAECRARGRRIELTIHGDGPLRSELEELISRLGVGHAVRLAGTLHALECWYPTLDAFVLPSLSEGLPLTVLEALACGCPVVASAVGGIPDLLDSVIGCSLVPPGDQEALVDALLAVPLRSRALQPARARVLQRHSLATMAEQYDTVYREAIALATHHPDQATAPLPQDSTAIGEGSRHAPH